MYNLKNLEEKPLKKEVEIKSCNCGSVIQKSLTRKELGTIERIKFKNEKTNADKIINKAINDEREETKKRFVDYANGGWLMTGEKINKSKQETLDIIEIGKEMGITYSKEDVRLIKQERRIQEKIIYPVQGVHYFKTLEQRVGTRGMYIVLMAVIYVIQGRADMPKSPRAYHDKVTTMATAQSGNVSGFFTTPFPGNATMVTKNGLLDTAIVNYEDDNGTGSTAMIEAAMAVIKIQVDLLAAFINTMCIANQTDAVAIIVAAKMTVIKQKPKGTKADFSVTKGAAGEVKLVSLAGNIGGKRVPTTYYWQYGLMVAGTLVWYDLPETVNQCKTTATGMPSGITVMFRKATRTKKGGLSAWSAAIGITPN